MGKAFSKALQKYYTRKGNRIIFSNGMTLNRLALEMWERLGYKEIDASVLSRVLKGERLFTHNQLKIFANILRLTQSRRLQLVILRNSDLEERYGILNYSLIIEDKLFIDLIRQNIAKITEFDFLGRFGLMGDWINSLNELIEAKIVKTFNNKKFKEILYQKALILIQQNHFLLTARYSSKVLKKILENSKKIIKLADELKRPGLLGSANMNIGDAFFVTGRYQEAINYLSGSIPYFSGESRKIAAGWTPMRSLALSYAHTNRKREFDSIKKMLLCGIEDLDVGFQIINYDALVRTEAKFQNYAKAQIYLDKCYDLYHEVKKDNGKYKELIPILLIRTELEIGKERRIFSDNYLKKRGEEGLDIASRYGYRRHWKLIKNLLDGIKN